MNQKTTHPLFLKKKGTTIRLFRVRHAKTIGQRFKGLLGTAGPEAHTFALVFHLEETTRIGASIHMLFMRMPIDVLWLDEKQQVIEHVENLPPWTFNYTPKKPARFIVELPAGTIKKYGLKGTKDKITW